MRIFVVATALSLVAVGCASGPRFHEGPTSLKGRERGALLKISRTRPDGFERFWVRPDCALGLVKWSPASSAAPEVPPTMLEHVRDEVGRLNGGKRAGETAHVTVTVFRWNRRWFGRPPEVFVEVVGRDLAGQILWMGEDRLTPSRGLASNLADEDDLLVARELAARLRKELGL